jgi:predicted Zn finger-like uncharacterized protein
MSMNTTCPKCSTSFRVNSEQLAAREGKVRCGRCSNVFNGFMYLGTPLEPLAERSLPFRPAGAPLKTINITKPDVAAKIPDSAQPEAPAKIADAVKLETPPMTILPEVPAPVTFDYKGKALPDEFLAKNNEAADFSSFSIIQPNQPSNHADIDLPDLAPVYTPEPWPIIRNVPDAIESHSPAAAPIRNPISPTNKNNSLPKRPAYDADDDTDLPDPLKSYFKDSVRDDEDEEEDDFDGPTLLDDAANRQAKAHWAWTIGGLLLLLAAALQTLYLFRVEVAQALPDARPLLTQVCSLFNCEVGLPQNIDTLSIESSDLVADPQRPDQIELRATLRNKARHVQAYPNLDFNLTDAQDETLVKRVITPSTYLKPPALPTTGFAPNSEINIKLQFSAKQVKPAGYRLLLFYP